MSILVKGIGMPEHCTFCRLRMGELHEDIWCSVTGKDVKNFVKPDWCPLVEVPDGKNTNADRIRAMDNEELGQFLEENNYPWCRKGTCSGIDCVGCAIEWLEEEAKDG